MEEKIHIDRVKAGKSSRVCRQTFSSSTGIIPLELVRRDAVDYESGLERDFVIGLSANPDLVEIQWNPIELSYQIGDHWRTYTPDYLVRFRDPNNDDLIRTLIAEVKYSDHVEKHWDVLKEKFAAAEMYVEMQGWEFSVVTEASIRTVAFKNAHMLFRYHFIDLYDNVPPYPEVLLQALRNRGSSTIRALLAVCYADRLERAAALTYLYALMAKHKILYDIDRPLTFSSQVWIAE